MTNNKKEQILNAIIEFQCKNKYSPSIREICKLVNLKSTSSVHFHLKKLEECGYIKINKKIARSIEIILIVKND